MRQQLFRARRFPSLVKLICLAAAFSVGPQALAQVAPMVVAQPAQVVYQQLQPLISLPLNAPGKTQQQSAKNGLLLSINAIGAQGLGYRPLEVTFTALTPAPADRSLTVEFITYHRFGMSEAVRVTEHVDLPAGAASAKATLRLPQYAGWDAFGVKAWEDGEQLEELSFERMGTAGQQFNEALPRMLVVGPASVDLSGLHAATAGVQQSIAAAGQTAPALVSLLEAKQLPDRWLDYTTFDIVVASWDQLDALMHNHPQAWQALRGWTSAGGNLVVYRASDDWQWLKEFETAAQPPAFLPSPGGAAGPRDAATADPAKPADKVAPQGAVVAIEPLTNTPAGWSSAATPQPLQPWLHNDAAKLVLPGNAVPPPARLLRPWDLGQVLVLRADPLTPDPAVWPVMWQELGDVRIAAAPRLGLSSLAPNPDFWNLLVPNVGLPPVDAFRVLITLFVLLIGPVNYFLLRRLQRLHLLVFIVPAAALLVTLSLLSYAILGDGLGVKIRPRTLTILDPGRGAGLCWQRLSYYAGLAPSGGLTFSPETAVFPLVAQPSPYGRGQATRVVVWGEHQNLTRGWLASRTPTQFVTLRVAGTSASIGVAAAGNGLELSNRLGTDILQIVVADDQGRFFHAADLPDGKSAAAKEMPLLEAVGRLASLMGRARPEAPAEMISGGWGSQRSYGFSGFDSPWPDPHQETSRLEQTLEQLSEAGKAGQLPLGPRSYAAIVRRSPLAEYGYEPVEEAGELHVILGRW
ncbi:MAG: hypothetical protein U0836_09505 [Pirellulales bacterium]